MKTHKGTAKRFKKTGSGKIKRSRAYTSHFMRHKSQKQKRKLRKNGLVSSADQKRLSKLI